MTDIRHKGGVSAFVVNKESCGDPTDNGRDKTNRFTGVPKENLEAYINNYKPNNAISKFFRVLGIGTGPS